MEPAGNKPSGAATADSGDIRQYDFKASGRLGGEKAEQIKAVHEAHARRLGIALGGLLRDTVVVAVDGVDETTPAQLLESIETPCAVFGLTTDAGEAAGLVDLSAPLALAFVDRLFGGRGAPLEEPREMRPIEKRLVRKVGEVLLREIVALWKPSGELRLALGPVASRREDLTGCPDSGALVVATLSLKTGSVEGAVRIAYAGALLAPLLRTAAPAAGQVGPKARDRGEVARQVGVFPMTVSAAMAPSMINVRDVLNLEAGDVLVLDSKVTDEVVVSVAGRRAFWARPGSHGGKLAVRITRPIKEGGKDNEPCG
jgi:flagellar motor switch protein FliM